MKKLPASSQKAVECARVERARRRRGTGCRSARRRLERRRRRTAQPEVGRAVAHEERHERQDDAERDDGDRDGGVAPADAATIQASSGRKISWPVAFDAVRTPVTSPRRATNQRLATSAASGTAIAPVASPMTTPQSRSSCHGAS